MRAYSLIRRGPLYRREAFEAGLRVAGYEVLNSTPDRSVKKGDLLLTWNRYPPNHDIACTFERAGGKVIVAENGYLGARGGAPKFQIAAGQDEGHYIALAVGYHNGAGTWPSGGPERWERLGVELKPWREDGRHVLVCPNRAFGTPGICMPHTWPEQAVARLRKATAREVRLRPHPGNNAPARPLADDLVDCHCVVIWNSSSGVHALIEGVPVVCEAQHWILKGATGMSIETPAKPERRPHFERLAWAQWTVAEIARGDPFFVL